MTPWTLQTVPMPTLLIRRRDDQSRVDHVIIWRTDGIAIADSGILSWESLEDYEHSTDGRTWLPCGVN